MYHCFLKEKERDVLRIGNAPELKRKICRVILLLFVFLKNIEKFSRGKSFFQPCGNSVIAHTQWRKALPFHRLLLLYLWIRLTPSSGQRTLTKRKGISAGTRRAWGWKAVVCLRRRYYAEAQVCWGEHSLTLGQSVVLSMIPRNRGAHDTRWLPSNSPVIIGWHGGTLYLFGVHKQGMLVLTPLFLWKRREPDWTAGSGTGKISWE